MLQETVDVAGELLFAKEEARSELKDFEALEHEVGIY